MNSETSPPESQGFTAGIQLRTSQLLLSHSQGKEYKYHNRLIKNPKVRCALHCTMLNILIQI